MNGAGRLTAICEMGCDKKEKCKVAALACYLVASMCSQRVDQMPKLCAMSRTSLTLSPTFCPSKRASDRSNSPSVACRSLSCFGTTPSSLSEREDFSAGEIDDKLIPCLSHSSELIAGSMTNGSQVQYD